MNVYERLYRKLLFPLYESGIRRRGTLRYLDEYEGNQWKSADELAAIQWDKTTRLLRHCYEHVPFYRERWKAADIHWRDIRSMVDYARLPTLTKDDIRSNYERLVADTHRGKTMRKTTGGSTGQPLAFEYTRESFERRTAVMMRGYAWAGAAPGRPTVYVWGGELGKVALPARLKANLHHVLLRRRVLSSFYLSSDDVAAYIREIDRSKPQVIVGFVNPLHLLARAMLSDGKQHWRPGTVITGAEQLHPFQRADIEHAFGCRVFNTYGCREFMLIASECPEREGLHVNVDHLVVELVGPDGRPAPEGEVAITDLHNYGMPFLRYVNGDLAKRLDGACACGRGLPRLEEVQGRVLDMIRTEDGRVVPGEFFPHMMKDVRGIDRFQVVQKDLRRLHVRIVKDHRFDTTSMSRLDEQVRRVLGPRIDVRYEFVPEIPLTPSGKQRVTISEIAP